MRKAGLRIVFLALVLVTFLGFVPQSASAAYENTHKNTGNYRQDIIAVALTQVGYRASDGKYNNKYGAYFGNNNDSWCGYFVSWCAAQAGVPTSILKRTGWASPSKFGIPSYSGKVYTPQPGDLYFQVNSSGSITHVGLVVAVDVSRGIAVTVEGNTWDSSNIHGVYRKERKIKDHIFGVPNYGDGGAAPHKHTYGSTVYESAHPHKGYQTCSVCGFKNYTGETQTFISGCQGCCEHTYGDWSKASSSKHQRTCSKCGYKDSQSHSWGNDKEITPATCKQVGKKEQTCSVCAATRTTDIPKVKDHQFSEWENLDEKLHQRVCSFCNTKETKPHQAGEQWSSDDEMHWHPCKDCGAAIDAQLHTQRAYCESPCEICKYKNPEGHSFEETYSWDENFHFRKCLFCPGQTDITPHQILTELAADMQEHYYPCSGCGYHHQPQSHTLSDPATEEQAQICLDCNFEYAPKLPHIHSFQPMQKDWQYHWSVCRCGKEYPKEPHKMSDITPLCAVCLEVPPEKPAPTLLEWAQENALYAWKFLMAEENRIVLYAVVGGAFLLLSGLTTTIVLIVRKVKKKIKEPVA